MAIAAKISPAELTAQVTDRFAGAYLEARLINAPGTPYVPGTTDDASFLAFEVAPGTGGYKRQVVSYSSSDVSSYSDDGVALSTRVTVFAHNGTATPIQFSHVALVWSEGNATSLGSVVEAPSAAVNGSYTNIPIDSASGSGTSMTVNLNVINAGALPVDYAVSIANPGTGYAQGDLLTILEGTLAGLGVVTAGPGNLSLQDVDYATQ